MFGEGTLVGPMDENKALCKKIPSTAGIKSFDISVLFMRECQRRWKKSDAIGYLATIDTSDSSTLIPMTDRGTHSGARKTRRGRKLML